MARSTSQFSITIPNEMAAKVRDKVASGEYATESEVVRDGLRRLFAGDTLEHWLRTEAAAAYDAIVANPSSGIPIEQVRASLAERHQKRSMAEKKVASKK